MDLLWLTLSTAVHSCRIDDWVHMLRPYIPRNEEQMGSTFFGGTVAVYTTRPAPPQMTETDRGIDGRASGCA
jgi:hypothetical protein